MEDYLSRELRLYVYNHEYSVTRLVSIIPSRSWGGNGALGCVLGFGALHRLPLPLTEPPPAPGETLFETARFSNEDARPPPTILQSPSIASNAYSASPTPDSADFLVPASMSAPPPPPPMSMTSSAPHARPARKTRHALSSNQGFDEYFEESAQKSKEVDYAPAAKATPPPPPPKNASAPPKVDSPAIANSPAPSGEGENDEP